MSNSNRFALYALISVFFFWGFVAASNTVLIGLFKSDFSLSQFQSQLVDLAFYAAYFTGSLLYFMLSNYTGDPLNRMGYKKGLVLGLLVSALGALGFIPAASLHSFPLMLVSLFIVGLGFALQQIVANPYVIALGSPETGSHRINLAGGINSFGTTIGPLLVSYAIFGSISASGSETSGIEGVGMPYLTLSIAFVLFAIFLWVSKLPAITNPEKIEKGLGALRFPQLIWGMGAIFVYVGVEVSIQSNMPALLEDANILGIRSEEGVHFISLYWGCLMMGRWAGALNVFTLSRNMRLLLTGLLPFAAFAVVLGVNAIKGSPLSDLLAFTPFILLLPAGFYLSGLKPAKTMWLFGSLAAILMLLGLVSSGKTALYCFISGGLFCSVMWPCIFSLSLAGLGKYTNQASALLIMMILGGALIPPLQGIIADYTAIHISYILPLFCFAFLALYGWKVKDILKKQGIDYDK